MEYQIILLFIIVSTIASVYFINSYKIPKSYSRLKISQSRSDFLRNDIYSNGKGQKEIKTQATDFHDSRSVRILMTDSKAYWIDPYLGLTVANLIDGEIDSESKKKLDTMTLSDVELKEVMFIVDSLTKGSANDSGSAGDKSF